MPRGEKDHCSNWMLQHHARALARLVGLSAVVSCQAVHARLTLPQVLPDGLLQVVLPEAEEPVPLLVEIEAYPSKETEAQIARDMNMAWQVLGVLPDTVLVVLCPRGQQRQSARRRDRSTLGWSNHSHSWKVVELSQYPAEKLLELEEIGVTPLLPLTRSSLAQDTLVQQCKERIERDALASERPTLLTITAVMASMKSRNVEHWLSVLGGQNVVEHSPLYQHWMLENTRKTKQDTVVQILETRFGPVSESLGAAIRAVQDVNKLTEGIDLAVQSRSLRQFEKRFSEM